jgi:hypothetical protein
MGAMQIVLVSTAGFSVLNTGIFWREAKTKKAFFTVWVPNWPIVWPRGKKGQLESVEMEICGRILAEF